MSEPRSTLGYSHDHLAAIERGMPVCDNQNEQIGTVASVGFPSDADDMDFQGAPVTLHARLRRSGFIKVLAEGDHAAYFATGDQIRYVNEGVVQLGVSRSALSTA